ELDVEAGPVLDPAPRVDLSGAPDSAGLVRWQPSQASFRVELLIVDPEHDTSVRDLILVINHHSILEEASLLTCRVFVRVVLVTARITAHDYRDSGALEHGQHCGREAQVE